MDENKMLYCLIAFILGYLVCRHMSMDKFTIGVRNNDNADSNRTLIMVLGGVGMAFAFTGMFVFWPREH